MPAPSPRRPRCSIGYAPVLRILAILVLIGVAIIPSLRAADEERAPVDPWSLRTFRFEFDNDTFLDSDDVFTAGWSFQFHSRLMDRWNPGLAGWIGKLPGLGDDGEGRRIVRWSGALSQIIITPTDLSIEEPQPEDAPWAGILGVTSTWSSYDNVRLGAFQIYLGCLGPCARGEQVQKVVHEDFGWGTLPRGWENQLSNKALANLNYEYRHKIYRSQETAYAVGRFGHDLAWGAQGALGNLTTFLQASLEYRFGWGLPMGFTKIPDPAGIGMVLDPAYLDPSAPPMDLEGWRVYFSLVVRYAWIRYLAPAEGGPTENGGHHPPLDSYPGSRQALAGAHLGKLAFGVHLTYYRYLEPVPRNVVGSIDWVNLSFEFRF